MQAVSSTKLLSGCLCHGYLDVYASLWSTWKLICDGSVGNLTRGGRWDDYSWDYDGWSYDDGWSSDGGWTVDGGWGNNDWNAVDGTDGGWGGDAVTSYSGSSDCSYSKAGHTMKLYSVCARAP